MKSLKLFKLQPFLILCLMLTASMIFNEVKAQKMAAFFDGKTPPRIIGTVGRPSINFANYSSSIDRFVFGPEGFKLSYIMVTGGNPLYSDLTPSLFPNAVINLNMEAPIITVINNNTGNAEYGVAFWNNYDGDYVLKDNGEPFILRKNEAIDFIWDEPNRKWLRSPVRTVK